MILSCTGPRGRLPEEVWRSSALWPPVHQHVPPECRSRRHAVPIALCSTVCRLRKAVRGGPRLLWSHPVRLPPGEGHPSLWSRAACPVRWVVRSANACPVCWVVWSANACPVWCVVRSANACPVWSANACPVWYGHPQLVRVERSSTACPCGDVTKSLSLVVSGEVSQCLSRVVSGEVTKSLSRVVWGDRPAHDWYTFFFFFYVIAP